MGMIVKTMAAIGRDGVLLRLKEVEGTIKIKYDKKQKRICLKNNDEYVKGKYQKKNKTAQHDKIIVILFFCFFLLAVVISSHKRKNDDFGTRNICGAKKERCRRFLCERKP